MDLNSYVNSLLLRNGFKIRVVPSCKQHKVSSRGDQLMKEHTYDATFVFGKSTVHVKSPPSLNEEKKKKILTQFHDAGWVILDWLEERKEMKSYDNF